MPERGLGTRLRPYGSSIFSEMSALSARHDAINLGQGFPDFDGPEEVRAAASAATTSRGAEKDAAPPSSPPPVPHASVLAPPSVN